MKRKTENVSIQDCVLRLYFELSVFEMTRVNNYCIYSQIFQEGYQGSEISTKRYCCCSKYKV